MKKIFAVLVIFALTSCIGAGVNSKIEQSQKGFFPQLIGIDLEGNKRQIPQAFDNKINLVAVAFKREQQQNVDGWIKVADEIMAKNEEVSFYELPVIYELGAVSRSFINNGMRRGVPDAKAKNAQLQFIQIVMSFSK